MRAQKKETQKRTPASNLGGRPARPMPELIPDTPENIMANKQPNGSEDLYARGLLSGGHGRTERKTKRQPSELKIPNAASLEAIEQTRTKEGLISYNSVDEMMADLFGDE